MSEDLERHIHDIARRAKAASDLLAELGTRDKDAWITRVAEAISICICSVIGRKIVCKWTKVIGSNRAVIASV